MEKVDFKGEFKRSLIDENGNIEVIFSAPNKPNLKRNQVYEVSAKESRFSRTQAQNRKLQRIINMICMEQDGNLQNRDKLYLQLLEMSGAKCEEITIRYDAIQDFAMLVKDLRVRSITLVNNVLYATVDVFHGSSKMDTKEMSKLIETAINYAYQLGVDVEGYDQRDIY